MDDQKDIIFYSFNNIKINLDGDSYRRAKISVLFKNIKIDPETLEAAIEDYSPYDVLAFLEKPKLSNFEHLFIVLSNFSKKHGIEFDFSKERVNEIFSKWKKLQEEKHEPVSQLFSNPIEKIFSSFNSIQFLMTSPLTGPNVREQELGFSLNVFEDGEVYHPFCYSELKKTEKGEKIPNESKS